MIKPKISICIPTYNRQHFLMQLLDSIASQADAKDVEIVISDNASSDDTKEKVEKFKAIYPNTIYYRWDSNQGADKNYMNAVEISTGKYCWLMGSDDIIPEGAIAKVLNFITDKDIYIVGRSEADINLKKLKDRNWLIDSEPTQIFDFSKKNEITRYFDSCQRLGGIFSYLSSIIVRRESWDKYPCDEKFYGTLYSHVYVLLSMVMNKCILVYIKDPLVVSRGGNDSFLTDWIIRGLIDLRGFAELGYSLIPDLETRRSFWSIMRREHTPVNIIKMRAMSDGKKWPEYKNYAIEVYDIPKYILQLAEFLYPITRLAFLSKKRFMIKLRNK